MSVGSDLDLTLDDLEAQLRAGLKDASDRIDTLFKQQQTLSQDIARWGQRIVALETLVTPPVPKLQLGAISYFISDVKWAALLATKPAVVIINPASGPGAVVSSTYTARVRGAKAAGCKVLGYVATGYGKRLASDVVRDMTNYTSWYGVAGFFFDQGANTDEYLPHYTYLCTLAHDNRQLVCINPGTKTTEGYAQIADYLMVVETDAQTYLAQIARPAWERNYPGKMWHCVHSCDAARMAQVVAEAKDWKAGLLWVTDDVMNNPYDNNPSYLAALAAELAK